MDELLDTDGRLAGSGAATRRLDAIGPPAGLGPGELLEWLAADQVERWRAGVRIPSEAYLAMYPDVGLDDDAAFELVYGEYLVRESLGEGPRPVEFAIRFPRFADRLRRQIALHDALDLDDAPTRTDGPEAGGGPAAVEAEPAMADGPDVPGYRLLGELGRGGWAWSTRRGTSGSTAWWR